MMNLDAKSVGMGVLGGAVAALLAAGGGAGSTFTVVLFLFSPLPIMAAALGWGPGAAIVAALTCLVGAVALADPGAAMVIACVIAVPSAVACTLFNLARPAEEVGGPAGKLLWFPLADTLFYTALAVAAGFIVLGFAEGYGPEIGQAIAEQMVATFREANPDLVLADGMEADIAAFLVRAIPAMQPAIWLILLVGNLYLASTLARASGLAARPRDDWPTALRLPRTALFTFGVALLVAFAAAPLGHIGAAFAGSLGAGFMLAGIAMFHARSRGRPWRIFGLWFVYFALAFFAFVIFFFMIAGLFDTRRQAVMSSPSGPPTT